MMEQITQQLIELRDEKYQAFTARLIPNISADVIIGVRMPVLRKFAKERLQGETVEEFMRELPHCYHEEYLLHGLLIERIKDFGRALEETERLLHYVDNWAVCDMFSPKVFSLHKAELLPTIDRWLASGRTYTVRFAMNMLMKHYLDDVNFMPEHLERVARACNEEFYVRMMTAWYFATALAKQYDAAVKYIDGRRLDRWTHNKTIQKAVESFRVTDEHKAYLKTLRYKR